MNAEEECLQKRSIETGIERVDQPIRSDSHVQQSKKAIQREVGDGNKKKEAVPRGADQVGIGQKCMQSAAARLHIKATVPIQQTQLTLL